MYGASATSHRVHLDPNFNISIFSQGSYSSGTLGFILENYLSEANFNLKTHVANSDIPIVGLDYKDLAIRQIRLAVLNLIHYYSYKGGLNDSSISNKRRMRNEELNNMIAATRPISDLDQQSLSATKYQEIQEKALKFIESLPLASNQYSLFTVEPYIAFSHETGKAQVKITGNFFIDKEAGIFPELFLSENKKAPLISCTKEELVFELEAVDFEWQENRIKNYYHAATLKCPPIATSWWGSSTVECAFEIVLGFYPPSAGRISYSYFLQGRLVRQNQALNWGVPVHLRDTAYLHKVEYEDGDKKAVEFNLRSNEGLRSLPSFVDCREEIDHSFTIRAELARKKV